MRSKSLVNAEWHRLREEIRDEVSSLRERNEDVVKENEELRADLSKSEHDNYDLRMDMEGMMKEIEALKQEVKWLRRDNYRLAPVDPDGRPYTDPYEEDLAEEHWRDWRLENGWPPKEDLPRHALASGLKVGDMIAFPDLGRRSIVISGNLFSGGGSTTGIYTVPVVEIGNGVVHHLNLESITLYDVFDYSVVEGKVVRRLGDWIFGEVFMHEGNGDVYIASRNAGEIFLASLGGKDIWIGGHADDNVIPVALVESKK